MRSKFSPKAFAVISIKIVPKHGRGSFAASINYSMGRSSGGDPGRVVHTFTRGIASPKSAALEMEAHAALNQRVIDPVCHLVVAYAPGERPNWGEMREDVERLLSATDASENQFVAAVHEEAIRDAGGIVTGEMYHVHVTINRVKPNGMVSRDSHDYRKLERICAAISLERGWTPVPGNHNRSLVQATPGAERVTNVEFRNLQAKGELPWSDKVRDLILNGVETAKDWPDLHRRLAVCGIIVKHTVKRGRDGVVYHGLSFAEGLRSSAPGCAASTIADDCKYATLTARFGPWIDRPADIVVGAFVESPRSDYGDPYLADIPDIKTDNALLRKAFDEKRRLTNARRKATYEAAWIQERALRTEESLARRADFRQRRSKGPRGVGPGHLHMRAMYQSAITIQYKSRLAADRQHAKERWLKTKSALGGASAEVSSFLKFVTALAEAGDPVAQRHLHHVRRNNPSHDVLNLSERNKMDEKVLAQARARTAELERQLHDERHKAQVRARMGETQVSHLRHLIASLELERTKKDEALAAAHKELDEFRDRHDRDQEEISALRPQVSQFKAWAKAQFYVELPFRNIAQVLDKALSTFEAARATKRVSATMAGMPPAHER